MTYWKEGRWVGVCRVVVREGRTLLLVSEKKTKCMCKRPVSNRQVPQTESVVGRGATQMVVADVTQ